MCRRLLVETSATANRSEDTLSLPSFPSPGADDFWPAVQQITRDIAGHFSSLAVEFESDDSPSDIPRTRDNHAQTQHEDENVASNYSGMYS